MYNGVFFYLHNFLTFSSHGPGGTGKKKTIACEPLECEYVINGNKEK